MAKVQTKEQDAPDAAVPAPRDTLPPSPVETAVFLAALLDKQDILSVAGDEPRARAIADALAVLRPDASILFCPGSDALPGDDAPASPANVGLRVAALRQLRLLLGKQDRSRIVLVTTGEACARLYPAPDAFDAAPPILQVGDDIDLSLLADELAGLGYVPDERVDEPGEMAQRGQVIDIFPADAGHPFRIEADAGRITAIRRYDPATQRTLDEVERLEVGRASEPVAADGVTLAHHLPSAALAVEPRGDERRRGLLALAADVGRRHGRRAMQHMAPDALWREATQDRPLLSPPQPGEPCPRFIEAKAPLRAFTSAARANGEDGGVLLLLGHPRDLRFLKRRLARSARISAEMADGWRTVADAAPGSAWMLPIAAERGFRHGRILAVAAADLLGSRALRGDAAEARADIALFETGDIATGDVIIHEDHGIGVVDGLEPLPGDTGGDGIAIRYADDGRRLVPVDEADRIWRYGADEAAVSLDRLDGAGWQKRRATIDAAIAETARALTAVAEERARQTAPVLEPDVAAYERFVGGFPFPETPDQTRAIAAVRDDLAVGRPMDRLVIGDVGYGKTEVALRAAAVAALAGYQVAIAAPTTVLARQHLETFRARFEGMDVSVAGLSRLSTPAERKAVRAGLADGSVRIVIGTGAVAGKGIAYEKLGLVIVDEEQRFGAADKERLRSLGAGHMLTLTATPIPRTLQGALVGLRQLSVIATPPARRQPIRTAVSAFDPDTLRAALLRERARGGQSFVVVPRIADMAPVAAEIARRVPELELLQAHGKMPAAEIDETMVRFAGGDGDILLATNIIEAGLDVPRANTMLIWRADRFGLAQLHQLRGRVGRGNRRGQVLLLTDADEGIAPRTLKRLRTLEAFDRLGAGFAISARDLDMRGAGDLLGETQTGHMKLIGIDLYQHLLAAALRQVRGEAVERWSPELNLGLAGRLPDAWIPEAELRVTLYARLARIADADALAAFEDELEDRFGELPPEAGTLIAVARVRLAAYDLGIARIDAGPAAIALTLRRDAPADLAAAGLEESKGRWLLREAIDAPDERLARIEALLEALAG